jgi:sarcosine oxidase, subunit alpha
MAGTPARRFLFDGRTEEARTRATILGALARERVPTLQRSIRYHRPRAPFCGIGYCTGCLVRVNGRPNVRACRRSPEDGDRVETENSWPSPRFDLLGVLDVLFPRGVDTLHGFRRPAWAIGAYQRVVRRLGGFGAVPDLPAGPAPPAAAVRRSTDVAIVGGGTSGGAAARRLAAAGVATLVLDRSLAPPAIGGVEVLGRTTVGFLPPRPDPNAPFVLVGTTEDGAGVEVRARSIVAATGGYDGSLLFAGNDRPGVLTLDAALVLAGSDVAPPFRRAVIIGGGARAQAALERFGERVDAVVAPGPIAPALVRRASELEVPLYPRSLVLGTGGRARVRTLRVRPRGAGPPFSLDCDAVVLAHRRLPSGQLLFQAGARMEWRGTTGAYYPVASPSGATSVPGLYAVGEVAGAVPADAAASGERAADALLGRPTADGTPVGGAGTAVHELDGYYRELLSSRRRGRWTACPCEDVLLGEIEEASRRGYRGIEVVKRYTGVGTGLCQGRYCLPDTILLLAILEGRTPPEVGYITQRPPVAPAPLGALAALDDPAVREAP